jgi:acetamidase/formamidase
LAKHRFEPAVYHATLGAHEPALVVEPGDTIATTTVDADGLDAEGRRQSEASNAQTGPFFVTGAEPGDALIVRFDAIWPNREWAVADGLSVVPGLVDPEYVAQLPPSRYGDVTGSWRIDRQRGAATFVGPDAKVRSAAIALDPMLGCFGVAPRECGQVTASISGAHGGNMDYRGFRAGVTVQLPVFVAGALFHLGDGHALQGDGEVIGGGIEVSMDVEFTVSLRKGHEIHWPRAEDQSTIFTVGNAHPLEQALRHATTEMLRWLQSDFALDAVGANVLLGMCAEYDLGLVCGQVSSVACKIAKRRLPADTKGWG